jgi:hypothetical protein
MIELERLIHILGPEASIFSQAELLQLRQEIHTLAQMLLDLHGSEHITPEENDTFVSDPLVTPPATRFNPLFPLKGLIRCPTCNALMTGSVSKGRTKSYAYYRCWKDHAGRTAIRADAAHRQYKCIAL